MSLHSHIIYWFQATLLAFASQCCLSAEKRKIPILSSLIWPNHGSSPRSSHSRRARKALHHWDSLTQIHISYMYVTEMTICFYRNTKERRWFSEELNNMYIVFTYYVHCYHSVGILHRLKLQQLPKVLISQPTKQYFILMSPWLYSPRVQEKYNAIPSTIIQVKEERKK